MLESKRAKIVYQAVSNELPLADASKMERHRKFHSVGRAPPRLFSNQGRIWTGCEFICSAYDDGRDAASYMCGERITAVTVAEITGNDALDVVLGCQV